MLTVNLKYLKYYWQLRADAKDDSVSPIEMDDDYCYIVFNLDKLKFYVYRLGMPLAEHLASLHMLTFVGYILYQTLCSAVT